MIVVGSPAVVDALTAVEGTDDLRGIPARLGSVLRDAELPPAQVATNFVPGLLTPVAPAAMVDEVIAIMSEFHPVGARVMARGFAEADLRDVLPTIEVPTLLLWGEFDVRSPLPVAYEMQARIPGATLVVIPAAGHLCSVEAADRFTAEVRAFLRSNADRTR